MNYIGLMSGTSLDGVDAVVYEPERHILKACHFLPYPDELKQRCNALIEADAFSFGDISVLENALAELYVQAVQALKERLPSKESPKAIGCHGQTIKHAIDGNEAYSIQLGNPYLLADKTGLPVVSHFRQKDIALGGQGAPLAPLFHQSLFQLSEAKVALNIGGIANISYLDHDKKCRGFDTGPGNVLLDDWIKINKDKPFDKGGAWSLEGEVSEDLLGSLMSDPYFSLNPPKSLDKHYFSLDWLHTHLRENNFPPETVQATLVAFTVETIIHAIHKVSPNCDTVIVSGGGVKNEALMQGLTRHVDNILKSDDLGYDSEYIEAMMIAWYAAKCFNREKVDLSTVTGSKKSAVHGAIVYP